MNNLYCNPAYFLISTLLANNYIRWDFLLDCFFRKLQKSASFMFVEKQLKKSHLCSTIFDLSSIAS